MKNKEVQIWLFDIHEAYKNEKAIDIVKQIIKKVKPNKIGFGGDETCYDGISKYTYKNPSYGVDECEEELNNFKETYKDILKAAKLKEKDTIFTLGNHNGERVDTLLSKLNDKRLNREWLDVASSLDFNQNFPEADVYNYGVPYRKNGLNIIHIEPNKANGKHHAQSMVIEYGEDVLYGHHHCFDDKTEILTDNGWKYIKEFSGDETVMTYNLEKDILEYNNIDAFIKRDEYKELLHIENKNIDLMVTPEHGIVNFINKNPEFMEARSLLKRFGGKFMCAYDSIREKKLELSDNYIKLIVWIAADGSFENSRLVRFNLKKERKITYLKNLLDEMDIKYSCNLQKSGSTKINFRLPEYLSEYFDVKNKRLPECFRYCNKEQAYLVLKEYSITDGNMGCGIENYQVCTNKECEADLLQEIFVTNGFRCNKIKRPNCFTLSVCARKFSEFKKDRITSVKYDGSVYCVAVKNKTLLTRRNGKVCLTQNTHQVFTLSQKTKTVKATSAPCLCNLRPGYGKNAGNAWSNGFVVVTFFDDTYSLELVEIKDNKTIFRGKLYD